VNPAPFLRRLVKPPAMSARAAGRAFPGATSEALVSWRVLAAAGAGFAAALALTWLLVRVMTHEAGATGERLAARPQTAHPGAIAASFLINIAALGVLLALAPLKREGPWAWWRAWLRGAVLGLAGFAGLWAAPGSGVGWRQAAALAALTASYGACLCGLGELAAVLAGRRYLWARAFLVVFWTLAVTGLFWSKPVLEGLKKSSPAAGDAATEAVVSLGPVTGVAAFWNSDPAGFNLIKTTHTYHIWLGSNFLRYPPLWPQRETIGISDEGGRWTPGLVLALGLWGLVLVFGCECLPIEDWGLRIGDCGLRIGD
jgi:hypothetical protein